MRVEVEGGRDVVEEVEGEGEGGREVREVGGWSWSCRKKCLPLHHYSLIIEPKSAKL